MVEITVKVTGLTVDDAVKELRGFGCLGLDEVPQACLTLKPANDEGDTEQETVKESKTEAEPDAAPEQKPTRTRKTGKPAAVEAETVCAQPTIEDRPPWDGESETAENGKLPEVKKEDVRAVLVKCRKAGISMEKILKPYGDQLKDVDPKDYRKLLADAEKALAEKEG